MNRKKACKSLGDNAKKSSSLTAREAAFITEYTRGVLPGPAALAAGYRSERMGGHLLSRPHVRAAITAQQEALARASAVSRERIVAELADLAGVSLGDYLTIDEQGQPRIDLGRARSLRGLDEIATDARGRTKIKLTDRLRAYALLVRILGYEAPQKVAATDASGQDLAGDVPAGLLSAMHRALGVAGAVAPAPPGALPGDQVTDAEVIED